MLVHKHTAAALTVKDAGQVTAVFADMRPGAVDRDGDSYAPGALRPGVDIPVSPWGHSSAAGGALPVGKAKVATRDGEAVAQVEYFTDLPAGRDAFEVLKRLGGTTQWSWTLDIRGSRPTPTGRHITDVHAVEVSPVAMAAGVGTRTESAKDAALRVFLEHQRSRHRLHQRPVTIDLGAQRARSRALGVRV